MYGTTLVIWILFMGTITCAPMDEYGSLLDEGELAADVEKTLRGIVPGYLPHSHKLLKPVNYKELKDDIYFQQFNEYVKEDMLEKGLTFNIYDSGMRYIAMCILSLIQHLNYAGYDYKTLVNKNNVNEDLLAYVSHIEMLYLKPIQETTFTPPFIDKPNFFVNGEVILKAFKLNQQGYNCTLNSNTNKVDVIENIVINTNYSGWNLLQNGGEEELNYLREDVSLNSYYYSVHLMHPYWFKNQVLESVYPRNSEYYYFRHQQLLARYILEKEFVEQGNVSRKVHYSDFNPYLVHDNGLPFPIRSNTLNGRSEDQTKIKKIDIAIRECLSRGVLFMDNETIAITEDNYVALLSKLIRANYDGIKTAPIIRSLFGYGNNGYPHNTYNPAPSVLHFPMTSLRDPLYWNMMKYALNYFTEYKEAMDLWNISQFEMEDVNIVEASMPKITTYFDYYQFKINKALGMHNSPRTITVRQKRLKHSDFALNFTINSNSKKDVVVRLFLGPPCEINNCWEQYTKFFELDKFSIHFDEGINIVSWSPAKSERYSNDEFYNLEESDNPKIAKSNNYNMFKFPENLVIPRGLENGLNLTVFIMISSKDKNPPPYGDAKITYRQLHHDIDDKPLGFPFHRPAIGYNDAANNYNFYKLTVYHKTNKVGNVQFSPNLD